MEHWRNPLFLFSATLALWTGSAGAEQLPLKIYTTADGLASDRVHCILADTRGFLWLGTEDGLSRFDGYGFTNLTTSDGLPGGVVRVLLESRDGTYWAATNHGLVHWDPARELARGHAALNVIPISGGPGADDSVRALVEDRSGGLWAGTHGGLFRVERLRDAWRVERLPLELPERSASRMVHALLQDHEGNLWIGTEDGLYRRLPDGTIDRIGASDGLLNSVRCFLEDRSGTLWAGQYRGIVEIRRNGAGGTTIRRAFSRENGFADRHFTNLFETLDGKIWAGFFGGLMEVAPDRSSVRIYSTADGLAGIGIWSLAEDRNGNLWIGSDNAGLMRLAPNGFRKYDKRDGLASTRIGSLLENRDGQLCAFTRGTRSEEIAVDASFLECFDGRRFQSVRLRLAPGTSFGWGLSQVMLQDGAGEWWIPSLAGLYRFPAVPFGSLGAASPRKVYMERDGLPSNHLFRLFQDRQGNLWIGFLKSPRPLALWSRATESFRSFSEMDGIPAEQPMAFSQDRTGAVWIGFESGIARFDGRKMSLFREADGLPAGGVQALHLDRDGRLWIASGAAGVARVDRPEQERPRFVRYGIGQGLSSESVSALTEDRWGRIYVATPRGLDRLEPESGLVQHFNERDGLARGLVETSFRDRQGNLWFGSPEGLSRLEPAVEASKPPPPVWITRVFAAGVRQALPDLGAKEVRLPDLGPGSAPVQIDFLAADFAAGGPPRYQYLLKGIDRDWSAATDRRSVVYARLPPGRHLFLVRGIGNDGSIGQTPSEVRFRILPPLWQRPEVLALLAAAVAGLGYLLHRHRLKSALAVERVRIRVATDLHDDVGAGLSEIAILSEVARRQQGDAPPLAVLQEIGDGARRLVDSMSDIVWSTDPRKDDVSSLVQRIRHFAANTLESRQIAWSLEVPPQFEGQTLDPESRRQIFLIVKEALTNIARHAGCRRACLRIVPGPHELSVEIEDDGVGFEALTATSAEGHGMANMRARAVSLGGELRIESGPSGGTRILARVPLRQRSPRLSAW